MMKTIKAIYHSMNRAIKIILGGSTLIGLLNSKLLPWEDLLKWLDNQGIKISQLQINLVAIFLVFIYLFIDTMVIQKARLKRKPKFFEQVTIGGAHEDQIINTLEAILNGEKSNPSFVHVMPPQWEETARLAAVLEDRGIMYIAGASGCGKSMAAWHISHLATSQKYRIYKFNYDKAESIDQEEFNKELNVLGASNSLLIFDDAHLFPKETASRMKPRLNHIVKQRPNLKVIWIETEFYTSSEDELEEEQVVHIEFSDLLGRMLDTFESYQNHPRLAAKLTGLGEARRALQNGKIRDLWQLSLIVSRADQRLDDTLRKLQDDELLLLFIISVYTVISGDQGRIVADYEACIAQLSQQAVFKFMGADNVRRNLKRLSKQRGDWKRLVTIYDINGDIGGSYSKDVVGSLHFNFARMVIRHAMKRDGFAPRLIQSISVLLNDDYERGDTRYVGLLIEDLKDYGPAFVEQHFEWLGRFITRCVPEHVKYYRYALSRIKDTELKQRLIQAIDLNTLAGRLSKVEANQLGNVATFMQEFPNGVQQALLSKLEPLQISQSIKAVSSDKLQQLADFFEYLGRLRDYTILDHVQLKDLAATASTIHLHQFSQLQRLMKSLKRKNAAFVQEMNMDVIAQGIRQAETIAFRQLGDLLSVLPYPEYDRLLNCIDLDTLAEAASKMSVGEFQDFEALVKHLPPYFKEQMLKNMNKERLADTANTCVIADMDLLSKLMLVMEYHQDDMLRYLDHQNMANVLSYGDITHYQYIHNLIKSLRPKLARDIEQHLKLPLLIEKSNDAEINQFQSIFYLIHAFSQRRQEYVQALHLDRFAARVKELQFKDYQKVHYLTTALGERSQDFMRLIQEKVPEVIPIDHIDQLLDLYYLLESFGPERARIIEKLDMKSLARVIHHSALAGSQKLSMFISALQEQAGLLLDECDISLLASHVHAEKRDEVLFKHLPYLLKALGTRRQELISLIQPLLKELLKKAYPAKALELLRSMGETGVQWGGSVNWLEKLREIPIYANQLLSFSQTLEQISGVKQQITVAKKYIRGKMNQLQNAAKDLLYDVRISARMGNVHSIELFNRLIKALYHLDPGLLKMFLSSSALGEAIERFMVTPKDYRSLMLMLETLNDFGYSEWVAKILYSNNMLERFKFSVESAAHKYYADDFRSLLLMIEQVSSESHILQWGSILTEDDSQHNAG